MNDFTREELHMLADGVVLIKMRCVTNDNTYSKLNQLDDKICSMINSYCEHDYSESLVKFEQGWYRACYKCGIKKP